MLDIQHISKQFGTGNKAVQVLHDININVQSGEFLILVGPSGCGKSTLLSLIAGLEQPTSGSIHIAGKDATTLAPKDRDIAMVFQSYALYPTMSVADNIGFALEMKGMKKAERQVRIAEVAKLLQIEPLLNRKPSALSGGQRQRVAMGRALARAPQLFLFDEPLSNLDAKLRVDMRAEIKQLQAKSGITSVYVTHDQVEAMTLGSRIAVMKDGRLQQLGTPDEIYNHPANTFVAGFMGAPSMNFVSRYLGDSTRVLGLRPEHIQIALASDDGLEANAGAAWRGIVSLVEPTGADTYLKIKTQTESVNVRISPERRLAAGDAVSLSFEARHAHWFDASTGMRSSQIGFEETKKKPHRGCF
jgi:multiple sugar transport system ATP-binding protein